MLQISVLSSSYFRLENKLDTSVKRIYQYEIPLCPNDMFGTFLLDTDPSALVRNTPPNHITFHLRVPIITLSAAQIAADRSIPLRYRTPDLTWHLNHSNEHYRASVQHWVRWIMQSDDNYMWMREVLQRFIVELKRMKAYKSDGEGIVSSVAEMVDREPVRSLQEAYDITKFPTNVRVSRAKLVGHRWMYSHYKGKPPEWWPYPTGIFSQEHIDAIDRVKLKLLTKKSIIVLDQAPDVCFTPPPLQFVDGKRWEDYNWKKFSKEFGNWHKVYEYDYNWLQRFII